MIKISKSTNSDDQELAIKAMLGLMPGSVVTLSRTDVARLYGVTNTRIAQIERRALRKLRDALEAEGLSFDDLMPEHNEEPKWFEKHGSNKYGEQN